MIWILVRLFVTPGCLIGDFHKRIQTELRASPNALLPVSGKVASVRRRHGFTLARFIWCPSRNWRVLAYCMRLVGSGGDHNGGES